MGTKLRIIMLSAYLPAADTSACARKIYDCIRQLHQRGHCIYLLSFCSQEDKNRIDSVRPYCVELHTEYLSDYSCYPHNSIKVSQRIDSLCRSGFIDILQCENSYLSRYIPDNVKIPLVLVEHEILSSSFHERSKLENNFVNKVILYARAKKKLFEEKMWYRKFSKIIVFSDWDKHIIQKSLNINNIEVIPLSINLNDYSSQPGNKKHYDLIYVGNFSHYPNVDAILHFYKKILALIKNKLPDISVAVVGSKPPAIVKRLASLNNNITVTGYIKNLQEIYSKSKVFIAPIRYGTGMRYKILEAMALNIPVVTTSVGARGIVSKENIKIADTETKFADSIIDLLCNPDKGAASAANSKITIEKYYNLNMTSGKYEEIYYLLGKAQK